MQKLESLGRQRKEKVAYARDVPTRSRKAIDEADIDRVRANVEDDGNLLGRAFAASAAAVLPATTITATLR